MTGSEIDTSEAVAETRPLNKQVMEHLLLQDDDLSYHMQ